MFPVLQVAKIETSRDAALQSEHRRLSLEKSSLYTQCAESLHSNSVQVCYFELWEYEAKRVVVGHSYVQTKPVPNSPIVCSHFWKGGVFRFEYLMHSDLNNDRHWTNVDFCSKLPFPFAFHDDFKRNSFHLYIAIFSCLLLRVYFADKKGKSLVRKQRMKEANSRWIN